MSKLWHHIFVMQYRPCYQMREKGHKQHVMNEIVFLHFALISVHKKCDLGESKNEMPSAE